MSDMRHPAEDVLAAYALGLLAETQSQEVTTHLKTCAMCEGTVSDYRAMAATLQTWREAPAEVAEATREAIVQRMRVHRLLSQLFVDADLRRRVGEDPAGVLSAHGIAPTPALLAAFKDLGAAGAERFPGELDERLTKVRRLLEWIPGAGWGTPLG